MYALVRLKTADLIAVYPTEKAAKAGLKKIKAADGALNDLGVVELDENGRPLNGDTLASESNGDGRAKAAAHLYDARVVA
jgi:hypothetical protein